MSPTSMSPTPTPSYTQTYFESSEIWADTLAPYQQQVLDDIVAIMPKEISTVLDVGCGNGLLTNALPEYLQVTGFDRSTEALSQVSTATVQGDITQLPFADASFDLVLNNDVLEHLSPNVRQQALGEMARVAKKAVIITVPFLEDLNQNSTRCGACDRFYHVNHHQAIFDLNDTQQLLAPFGWTCNRQVLSGANWELEQLGHVAYKRLHRLEWAHADAPLCPHCGSRETQTLLRPESKREEQLQILQRARAQEAIASPLVSDWCERRTECISLYSKQSIDPTQATTPKETVPTASPTFITAAGHPVELPATTIHRDILDFTQAHHYKKEHLPNLSTEPYFLFDGQTSNAGIEITAGQSLVFGFYVEPSTPIEISFIGTASPDTKVAISHYTDHASYQLCLEENASEVLTTATESTPKTISLERATLCSYGYLFQIIPTSGNLHLSAIKLTHTGNASRPNADIPGSAQQQIHEDSYKAYDNTDGKARFLRLPTAQPVDLSLPLYGRSLKEYAWIQRPEILSKDYFPIVELATIAQPPRWMQQLLRETAEQAIAPDDNSIPSATRPHSIASANETATGENASSTSSSTTTEFQPAELSQNDIFLESNRHQRTPRPSLPTRAVRKLMRGTTKIQTQIGKHLINKPKSWVYSPKVKTYQGYRQDLIKVVEPELIDQRWQYSLLANKQPSFLMICHDQNIDRRIVQQAQRLLLEGWQGKVISLSFDQEDKIEQFDGVDLHRIGLKRIIPDCPFYWRYHKLYHRSTGMGKLGQKVADANAWLYKYQLNKYYGSGCYGSPLPFDWAFYAAGKYYPADLVFAHDLPGLKAASQLADRWQARLIYDAHELYSEQKVFSPFQHNQLDIREKEYIGKCDAVMTVSASFARVTAEKNQVALPEVILNVTQKRTLDTQNPPRVFHEILNLPDDHIVVLSQGAISLNRNLDTLVKGFVQLNAPKTHLVFLGPPDPTIKQELEEIAGAALDKTVHFVPPVSQAELLTYTTSADIGLIPYAPCDLNTLYCMPNKMFEYIQACLPILANDLVEVGNIINSIGGGGLVADLNTAEGVAKGIAEMRSRDLKADRQKLAAVRDRFCWEYEAKRYMDIINNTMASPAKSVTSSAAPSNTNSIQKSPLG